MSLLADSGSRWPTIPVSGTSLLILLGANYVKDHMAEVGAKYQAQL